VTRSLADVGTPEIHIQRIWLAAESGGIYSGNPVVSRRGERRADRGVARLPQLPKSGQEPLKSYQLLIKPRAYPSAPSS
jgi:hypothetical protein